MSDLKRKVPIVYNRWKCHLVETWQFPQMIFMSIRMSLIERNYTNQDRIISFFLI